MADYYTHFSFTIDNLTDEESAAMLAIQSDPDALANFAKDGADEIDVDYWHLGVQVQGSGDDKQLWIHDDGGATTEDAAIFVQAFLKRFRPDCAIGFQYANTCSKPRTDAYGGGAYYVDAKEIDSHDGSEWLRKRMKQASASRETTEV